MAEKVADISLFIKLPVPLVGMGGNAQQYTLKKMIMLSESIDKTSGDSCVASELLSGKGELRMVNIDYIMELFDWNNSNTQQSEGLKLAEDVKCISAFIQPGRPYGKNVWDNCAKALAQRPDRELEPYLFELMEWLQDMNWPGAFCIFERLKRFEDRKVLLSALSHCAREAKQIKDESWKQNLIMLSESLDRPSGD